MLQYLQNKGKKFLFGQINILKFPFLGNLRVEVCLYYMSSCQKLLTNECYSHIDGPPSSCSFKILFFNTFFC